MARAGHRPGAGGTRASLKPVAAGAWLALALAAHAAGAAAGPTAAGPGSVQPVAPASGASAAAGSPGDAESAASDAAAAAAADAAGGDVLAIDPRRSSASFLVTLRMRGAAEGRIPGVRGTLRGSAATGWRVDVRLDAKGLRFPGPQWMERATRSASFLAVDRYPSIRFASETFDDALLRSGGELAGELTLRGQRHPVAFTMLPPGCARPGRDCDIRVEGAISRRAFGMTAHRAIVLDRVDLRIRARLQGPRP